MMKDDRNAGFMKDQESDIAQPLLVQDEERCHWKGVGMVCLGSDSDGLAL
jgi:hypothetical protein